MLYGSKDLQPSEIKYMLNDTKSFKLKLTTFLLQNSFYTIEEFFELKQQ
jgi:hypothetical protein